MSNSRIPALVKALVLVATVVVVSLYSVDYLRGAANSLGPNFRSSTSSLSALGPRRLPFVGSLNDTPTTPSNHPADVHGDYIMKQVMIPNGKVPGLMGFHRAVLKPQQMVQRHTHATMHEVFFVERGRAIFLVDEDHHVIETGGYIHIPAGEPHSILNLAKGDEARPEDRELVLLYFGIADD